MLVSLAVNAAADWSAVDAGFAAPPAEFRLSSDRVQIRRTPEGDLIIHPCPAQRGQALLEVLQGFSDDFVLALEQQQRDPLPIQERQPL